MLNMPSKYSKASENDSIEMTPKLTYLLSCLGSVTPRHGSAFNTQLAGKKTWGEIRRLVCQFISQPKPIIN